MPIHDFSVGDRVLCVAEAPSNNESVHGLTGTVVSRTEIKGRHGRWLGVCWDISIPHGHSCDGVCEDGHGYFVWEEDVTEEPSAVFDICPEDTLVSLLSV